MYGLIPLFLAPIFLLWVLYRFFIKKDLKKHQTELYTGVVFIALWVIIYTVIT